MKYQEVYDWAIRHGYSKDRYGHLTKAIPEENKTYRLRLSKCSVRKEVKTIGSKFGWVRLRSGYLRDCSLNDKDQLSGMTMNGCTPLILKP